MGYYTSYNLEVRIANDTQLDDIIVPFLKNRGIANYALSERYERYGDYYIFYGLEPVKWYEYDQDMIDLSLLVPEATFKLSGDGENFNDAWNNYYQNGKMEECWAEIPPPKKIAW